jgi:hypothetical protein
MELLGPTFTAKLSDSYNFNFYICSWEGTTFFCSDYHRTLKSGVHWIVMDMQQLGSTSSIKIKIHTGL